MELYVLRSGAVLRRAVSHRFDWCCVVIDRLTGGELFDRIVAKGSYSEKEASDLIKSVASAIMYLHSVC